MEIVGPILLLFGPLIFVCSLFYAAGDRADHPKVGRTLRASAVMWFGVLAVIYIFVFVAAGTCSGNMLYGYVDCRFIPPTLANVMCGWLLHSKTFLI